MKCFLLLVSVCALTANPVGQVLKLLQNLHDTVVTDGEVELKQFEEYGEWCEDEARERQNEIKTAKAKSNDFRATIEKASADIEVATAKIGELTQSIATSERDAKEATAIREKENKTYKATENELVETVDTLRRAQQVLKKSLQGGSFVQLPDSFRKLTSSLTTVLDAAIFSSTDTSKLHAFLQQGESEEGVNAPDVQAYESKSGGIIDTIADLQDKAEAALADARKTEVKARHSFESLVQSLNNESKVQNDALTTTKKQLAATSEVKATGEGDFATTVKDLNEDEAYVSELSSACQQRAVDFELSSKGRAEELKALTDAKKIIAEATGAATDREYSLVQVEVKVQESNEAIDKLTRSVKSLGRQEHNSMLVQLAGKIRAAAAMNEDPFGKVKGLIQDMVAKLVKEASEEASQKAFCDKETSENEAKRDKLEAETNKLSTRIEKATADVASLRQQIAELNANIAHTAKSQKELDSFRKQEQDEWTKAKNDFEQGLQGVRSALKVLREYYQSEGKSFMQTLTKQGSKNTADSIISILEVAESDFARSLAEGQSSEDDEVDAYEKTTQGNKVSTATKKAAVEGKTQEAARLEQLISESSSDRSGVQEEATAVLDYLAKLRPQCVQEPESYEDRKARREREIEGLKTALEVLQSETAFIQTGTKHSFLSRSRA